MSGVRTPTPAYNNVCLHQLSYVREMFKKTLRSHETYDIHKCLKLVYFYSLSCKIKLNAKEFIFIR